MRLCLLHHAEADDVQAQQVFLSKTYAPFSVCIVVVVPIARDAFNIYRIV